MSIDPATRDSANSPAPARRVLYLDLDGVCCDFHGAALRLHGRDPERELLRWAREFPGEFHAYRVLGLDRDAFWDPIHRAGAEFWAGLAACPWFDALLHGLRLRGRVVFLSSGTWDGDCLAGKLRWLQARFGRSFADYIFTPRKDLLARPEAVLIDDYPANIAAFSAAGGRAVLFPRIWNSPAPAHDPLPGLFASLDPA